MEENNSEKEPLVEEGEVPSSEGQPEEEDFDIYKGFDIDEPFEANCTDNDEEWRIFNLSAENSEETKKDECKGAGKEADPASETTSLQKQNGVETSKDETHVKSLLESNHSIPSLMSLKTEPPEYYTSRRPDRKHYGHKWRNSRNREYDRGSPYRNRKESYEARQQFYDRRNKTRLSDSRFK